MYVVEVSCMEWLPSQSTHSLMALGLPFSRWVMEVGRGRASDVVHKFVSAGVLGTCVLGTTTSVGSHAQVTVFFLAFPV